jgi:hypothetical protein
MSSVTTAATTTVKRNRTPAPPPLTRDRAMIHLAERYELSFSDTGTGWYFAHLTDGDRRLMFRLGGKNFRRFLKERAFPRTSERFIARLVRRCKFLAWLHCLPSRQ